MTYSAAIVLVSLLLQAPATPPPASATEFRLSNKGGLQGTFQVSGNQVLVKDLIARLSKDIGVPIKATALVSNQRLDLSLKDASLPVVLTRLAPVALADIEIGAGPEDTQWKTIHLLAYNEKLPPRALRQVGFLLGAGSTKDETVTAEEALAETDKRAAKGLEGEAPKGKPMLAVSFKDGLVGIRSIEQHLAVVMNEVATRAGVPFDIRGTVDPIPVDIEIRDLPLADLPVALGRKGVRFIIRRDLATGEEGVQGVLLGEPPPPPTEPAPTRRPY